MKKPPSPFRKKQAAAARRGARSADAGAPRVGKPPVSGRPVAPSPAAGGAPRERPRRSAARAAAKLETLAARLGANVERLSAIVTTLKAADRSPAPREVAEILARVQRDYVGALGEKNVLAETERARRQAAGQVVVRHLAQAGIDFAEALELVARGAAPADVVKALAPKPAPKGRPSP